MAWQEKTPPLIEDKCRLSIKGGVQPGSDVDDKIQKICSNNLGPSIIAGLTTWLKVRCTVVDR
jgi:hypothetical protein